MTIWKNYRFNNIKYWSFDLINWSMSDIDENTQWNIFFILMFNKNDFLFEKIENHVFNGHDINFDQHVCFEIIDEMKFTI